MRFLTADPCCFQYYDDTFATVKEQKAFERNLFNKTHRANAEVIMLDGLTCIYRNSVDLFFYVMGNANENGVISTSTNYILYLIYLSVVDFGQCNVLSLRFAIDYSQEECGEEITVGQSRYCHLSFG